MKSNLSRWGLMFAFVASFGVACTKKAAEPKKEESMAAHHHAEPPDPMTEVTQNLAAKYGADLPEKEYLAWVRQKIEKLPDGRPARAMTHYIDYVERGKSEDAKKFIEALKAEANRQGKRFADPDLSLFEGSLAFCWPPNGACSVSVGSVTLEHFVPRLQKGNKDAWEILFIYSQLVGSDGAEAEGMTEILDDQDLKKHKTSLWPGFEDRHKALLTKIPR